MNKKGKKKGFTLVELLAVIVILSILMVIAVPATLSVSKKVKTKMLNNKMELAEKAAVLWAQDNRKCLALTNSCSITCNTDGTDTNKLDCTVTLDKLAADGYIDYDDQTNKKIISPINKKNISTSTVSFTYNTTNHAVNISKYEVIQS